MKEAPEKKQSKSSFCRTTHKITPVMGENLIWPKSSGAKKTLFTKKTSICKPVFSSVTFVPITLASDYFHLHDWICGKEGNQIWS